MIDYDRLCNFLNMWAGTSTTPWCGRTMEQTMDLHTYKCMKCMNKTKYILQSALWCRCHFEKPAGKWIR